MLRIFRQYYPIRNVFFVIGEFFVIFASGFIATWLILGAASISWVLQLKILLITFICQTCLYYNDLYDFKITDSFYELFIRLLQSLGASAILLAAIYTLVPKANIGLKVFVITLGFDILFIVSWRIGYTIVLNKRLFDRKIVVLGCNELARNVIREIKARKDCGYVVSGVILEGNEACDLKLRQLIHDIPDTAIIGFMKQEEGICRRITEMKIEKVIVAIDPRNPDFPDADLLKCRVAGIDILEGNSFYEMLTGKLNVDCIRPEWLIFSDGFKKSWTRRSLKRLLDLVLSLAMSIAVSPLVLITALAIKLDAKEPAPAPVDIWRYFAKRCQRSGTPVSEVLLPIIRADLGLERGIGAVELWRHFHDRCREKNLRPEDHLLSLIKAHLDASEPPPAGRPVFFSQERVGMNGRPYRILKFRSMVVNAEKYSGPVWAGEDDKRITRLGHFIRKWRIDELPQLWNVIKGEMSFVGPRPERDYFIRQLEKTIPYYRERLSVKPGLTGWAQVSYGYGASEDDAKEKLNYDLFYIKNMSIPMDLMIVLKTVKIVLFGKGR